MNRYLFYLGLFLISLSLPISAQESWIVPLDSPLYRRAEELFLTQGSVPPFEETPVVADDLRGQIENLIGRIETRETADRAGALLAEIHLPFPTISPILELGLGFGFNSETDRKHKISSSAAADGKFLDYLYLYDLDYYPAILKIGLIAQAAGCSILFQPELNETLSSSLADYNLSNLPSELTGIDNNFPFRGIAAFYSPPFELRIGRDKLNLGPGNWSTLTLSKNIPYFDYLKARFTVSWFSLSWYIVRLNPTLSLAEGDYMDDMYEGIIPNPEDNADLNGKPYIERAKHYIIGKLGITPFPWLYLSVAQTNLIGGRLPQLADFNPLIIFHNTYAEGVYSVPLSVSATVVPYRGIKLYLEYLFYDASVGDEAGTSGNPGASAYQAGFTLLSDPFFKLMGGRFRLDGEISYIDPWVYGKYYSLRQFTSRIIYVEHYGDRHWVDYPLGFYLGPDAVDIHLSLAYGIAGEREVELHWNRSGIGQIDLYGFGPGNDYSHAGESGYPFSGSPTGTAQWTDKLELSFYWVPARGLKLSTWYYIKIVTNRFHEDGNNPVFHSVGVSGTWKIF